jgi:SEFIR domain/ATPase family associated with various cellular activities (AAA)
MTPCKVFISYSHDSENHQQAVLNLADRLREEGVNCIIDQYEQSPTESWPRWATNQIEEAEFVLVVCTERYSRLFAGKGESVEGRSANWQGAIIIQSLYDSQTNNKFIPIVLSAQDAAHIPVPLCGATAYEIDTALGYEQLYRHLTGQFATPMPVLGAIQKLPRRDRLQFFLNEDRQSSLKEELLSASKGLLDWKRTLGNNQQITRPELVQLINRIETETSSTTIVLGSPGCGKSALMATLGHWAIDENYVLLAIKADYLSNTVNTLEDLQQNIHLSWNIRDAIRAIASTDKVILLIDQLDAVAEMLDRQPGRLNVLLSLIQSLTGTKNVHIVATCREFEFRHGIQFARLESFERMDLHLPAWEDIAPFLEKEHHNPNAMGEPLRELLQNPLHLRIFLEIAKPGDVFESLPRLLDQLWQVSIVEKPQPKESIAFLTELADRMTKEEVLWLPSAIGDEHPEICGALKQSGILMTNPDNSTLGFCHQTFYDHTLARAFARGSKSLIDLVLDRQDGIFVRPVLLRSLNYLRGTTLPEYQRQLRTLLTSSDRPIRPHIRTLLLEFVGAQAEPNATEASLLIPLLNSETEGIKVLDAMIGSPGWFRKLRDRSEFTQWLEKPVEQSVYCVPLMAAAASFAIEDVWGLLEDYWLHEQAYDLLSIRVIWGITHWTTETVHLAQQVIQRSQIDWHSVSSIAERIAEILPGYEARIIRAHLDQRLAQTLSISSTMPDTSLDTDETKRDVQIYHDEPRSSLKYLLDNQSDFYAIGKFAQANPESFLEANWSWLIEIMEQIVKQSNSSDTCYREDCAISLDQYCGDIVKAFLIAILELAQRNQQCFLEFVMRNLQSDILLIHRLFARGLEKVASHDPHAILSYLLGDPRRLCLGDTIDGHHHDTKRLIASVCSHLSHDDIVRLENSILQFDYRQPWENCEADIRLRLLKYNRQYRLQLLLAFPDECLSSNARKIKNEEIRAFPWEASEDRYTTAREAQLVGPRMTQDEMSRASDQDLLNLMTELPDETMWNLPQRSQRNDFSRSGSSFQQSREFGKLVQNNPDIFLRLLPQLQPQKHEVYAGAALLGLSETNFPVSQLLQLVEDLNQRGFSSEDFYNDAACALEKIAERNHGLPSALLDLLKSWLLIHSKPELEHYRSKEDRHTELKSPILFNVGGSHSLPGGRGNMVRALADGYLKQNPPDLENWARFIRSQLGVEPHPAVWVDILTSMPPLLNGDRAEATDLFDQVIRNCPEILQYSWALYFIAHTISWFEPKETVQGWLEMLQAENSNFSQQAYGELLLIQYLQYQDEWSVGRIRHYLTTQNNDALLCGLAHAASHLWGQRKCRAIAAEILHTLAASANKSIQHAVAAVFRCNRDNFRLDQGMLKIIQAVCKNQGVLLESANNLTEIIEAEELVETHPEVVAEVCASLVGIGTELSNPARATALIAESITTIAIQLHRQSPYREVGLQIFEQLLAFNLRETVAALETLDRKPNRPGSYLAPRRRIRGRRTRR